MDMDQDMYMDVHWHGGGTAGPKVTVVGAVLMQRHLSCLMGGQLTSRPSPMRILLQKRARQRWAPHMPTDSRFSKLLVKYLLTAL